MNRSRHKIAPDGTQGASSDSAPLNELDGTWRLEQRVGEELGRLSSSVLTVQDGLAPITEKYGNEMSPESALAIQDLDLLTQVLEDLSKLFLALGQNPELCSQERRRLVATGRLESLSKRLLHTDRQTPDDTIASSRTQVDLF